MNRLDRRRFLSTLGAAFAGAAVTPGALASTLRREADPTGSDPRTLILLNLQGGYDALSMMPPTSGPRAAAYQALRPTLAWVPGSATPPLTLPGVSGFGLHPKLSLFANLFAAGDLAIVQKTGLPIEQRSHFAARDVMARGRADLISNADRRGWLGRLADNGMNTPLDIVAVGAGQREELVANGASPISIDKLDDFNEDAFGLPRERAHRNDVLRALTSQSIPGENRIRSALRGMSTQAHDLSETLRASTAGINLVGNYPGPIVDRLSLRFQDIAKLMMANPATRIFLTSTGDFDTHGNEETQGASTKQTLSERLDAVTSCLSALIDDLVAMGRWNSTAIVIYTEFGRRNRENDTRGTDHAHGYHTFVLGGCVNGGLKGGQVTTGDINSPNLALPAAIDYRTVFRKCLIDWLQLPVTTVNTVFDDYVPIPGEPGFNLF